MKFRQDFINLYKSINKKMDENDINDKVVKYIFNKLSENYKLIIEVARYLNKLDISFNQFFNEQNENMLNLYLDDKNNNTILLMLSYIKSCFLKCLIFISELHLLGEKEINVIESRNVKYHVIINNSKLNKKSFELYLLFYYVSSLFIRDNLYIGLDFEFNSKVIALMQINFEEANLNKNLVVNSFIFIIYPPDLNDGIYNFFIKKILCNKKIFKILHGSDSLDIPYIYYELLKDNELILKFTNNLIDTRFLCEYNIIENNLDDKCKIYFVLNREGIITDERYNYLLANEKEMGPIYDIIIDINNLTKPLIKYTLYDVIYLKYLFLHYKKQNLIYDKVIPEITQIVFLDRRGITDIIKKVEIKSNEMNNFMINKYRINDLFKKKISKNIDKKLDNLLKIKYFKKTIMSILKYIFYSNLQKKNIIYKNKNLYFEEKLSLNEINTFLKNYNSLKKIINNFNRKL